ncbi:MAG: hypothetical protein JWR04_2362 [Rhodoglobus sp.]|nr:hypothetical protein [Rhodoglobus sp.]
MRPGGALRLTWPEAATEWVEAVPLGNGRIGAMAFGGAAEARYQLNDSTAWSGTPDGPARALDGLLASGVGPHTLEAARRAQDAGDYREAERLLMTLEGEYSQEFLPLADLVVLVEGGDGYRGRSLDLDHATLTERFSAGTARVTRRSWVSAPAEALCVCLSAEGGTVDVRLALSTPLRPVGGEGASLGVQLPVDGAPLHEKGVAAHVYREAADGEFDPFAAVHLAVDTDGTVETADGTLSVRGATRILVALATATRAESWWSDEQADPANAAGRAVIAARARGRAERAVQRGHEQLHDEHVADVTALKGGTFVAIGPRGGGEWDVAGDVLAGGDSALTATVIAEFGRYLLASSSRAGSPPANLQGIWNAEVRPAWSSNYTVNINTQMNYWAAESAGMPETQEPLARLVGRVASNGTDVARRLYGARGWVAHHNTDQWGWALPVGMGHGNPSWAIWMMGGVWLAHSVWDHWDFTRDDDYLRATAWPVLRGAAEFCLDWLVDDGAGGLRTIPSTSPENLFVGPDGHPESLTYSVAMDVALIRSLFERCLAAGIPDPLLDEIAAALPKLPAITVAADGRLAEWGAEVVEHDPHHRHMSPMIALYPLDLIGPDLVEPARRFLDARGPGAMGWSWAWKIALRARLGDGGTALALLKEATAPFDGDHRRHGPVDGSEWGGLLPNLFSTHPPFQIDGNFGLLAGILEMLVQGHGGRLRLLPALPDEWAEGSIAGVGARGGLSVDLAWAEGRLVSATIRTVAGPVRVPVHYAGGSVEVDLEPGIPVTLGPDLAVRDAD